MSKRARELYRGIRVDIKYLNKTKKNATVVLFVVGALLGLFCSAAARELGAAKALHAGTAAALAVAVAWHAVRAA